MTRDAREGRFFVQESSGQRWHEETEHDCELMLCGARISVNAPYLKVRSTMPSRSLRCPDCFLKAHAT